jgi:hypothetical protein
VAIGPPLFPSPKFNPSYGAVSVWGISENCMSLNVSDKPLFKGILIIPNLLHQLQISCRMFFRRGRIFVRSTRKTEYMQIDTNLRKCFRPPVTKIVPDNLIFNKI